MPRKKPAKNAPEWAANLTYRERAFVESYVLDFNGSAAIRRVGYTGKNADVRAHELLHQTHIAEAISVLVAERAGVSAAMVLEKLGAIVTTNVNDVMEVKDGALTVKDTAELSPEALVAVAGYEERVNERGVRTINVKLHDRIAALSLLAKCLGMRRSPSEAPSVAVQVNVNNTTEASNRVLERLDAMLARRPALPALPAPTEQPMEIEVLPVKETVDVES